jgi:hypothetical protein
MRFLITWSWDKKDSKEVTERFTKWKPVGDVKFLLPIHTVIGANKAFTVTESSDIKVMAKNIQPWTDICIYTIEPVMDSRELIALLA